MLGALRAGTAAGGASRSNAGPGDAATASAVAPQHQALGPGGHYSSHSIGSPSKLGLEALAHIFHLGVCARGANAGREEGTGQCC